MAISCFFLTFFIAGSYVARKISNLFSRQSAKAVTTGAAASSCPFRGESPAKEEGENDVVKENKEYERMHDNENMAIRERVKDS